MHIRRPRIVSTWRLAALAVAFSLVAVLFAGAAPAFAQPKNPRSQMGGVALERAYQREQKWLTLQTDQLSKADQAAAKLQAFIDNQKSQGKDTTLLKNALNNAKAQLATAHSEHNNAANILGTHAGFDNTGKVTNLAQARQTIFGAVQALRDAHRTLYQAIRDIRATLHVYRQGHPTD